MINTAFIVCVIEQKKPKDNQLIETGPIHLRPMYMIPTN